MWHWDHPRLSRTQQWSCTSCCFMFKELEAGIIGQCSLIQENTNPKLLSDCKSQVFQVAKHYEWREAQFKATFQAKGRDTSLSLVLTSIVRDNCNICWFKFSTWDPQFLTTSLQVKLLLSSPPLLCFSEAFSLAAVTHFPPAPTYFSPLLTPYFRLKWKCHPLLPPTSPSSKHMAKHLHPYSHPDSTLFQDSLQLTSQRSHSHKKI